MASEKQIDVITSLILKGNLNEAESICCKLLGIENNPELVYLLAVIKGMQGKTDDSLNFYKFAIEQLPERGDIAYNYGVELLKKGETAAVKEQWLRAAELDQTHIEARYNLAKMMNKEEKTSKAEALYKEVLNLDSSHKDSLFNLANLYFHENKTIKAVELYKRLLEIDPNCLKAWSNLGKTYKRMKDLVNSEKCYREALKKDPENIDIHWSLSHLLLLQGKMKQGFAEYEWRLKKPEAPHPEWRQEMWDGSDIKNKKLLLWGDQGIGDNIQFLRFVKFASERAKEVSICCQTSLVRLAETAQGVSKVAAFGDYLPEFDVHAPLMSLPHILGIYETSGKSYLTPASKVELKDNGRKRIGLVWSGNPDFPSNKNRSCSLKDLQPLLDIPEIDFYSLQVGEASKAIDEFKGKITDLSPYLSDFSDTASVISQLDLVITVDTGVAHLAGALGKPVWIMLSAVENDWRWSLDTTKNKWYPTATLFRQKTHANWADVVAEMVQYKKLCLC